MGVSFSYPFADFDDLDEDFDEDFEALIMSSTNFNDDDDVKKTWRSASFNSRDFEPTICKSFRSLSFNRRELDSFHSIATVSLDSPLSKEGTLRSASCCGKEASDFSLPSKGTFEGTSGSPVSCEPRHQAAVKLQKVYKSFQTRRRLADCAVLVEQHWWKLLDFALLKQSSISFFDIEKPQTALSRWSRARTRAAMVGRGLSKDKKARKLALQHWLEAIDPRHRYGHNLHIYYVSWLQCESKQPFFYWLDVGEGRDVNIEECPRSTLQHQCIKYLGPKEREAYEVVVENGMFHYKHNGELLDTYKEPKDTKWIFVLSTSKNLYVGQKKKGVFQHSSFLAGGATSAAGRLVVEKGILKAVWPHSGHYRPTKENFQEFIAFLKKKNVDLTNVKESPEEEELESWNKNGSSWNKKGSYADLRGDLLSQGNLLSRPVVSHDISTGTSSSSTGQERSMSNEEGLTTTTTGDLRMESGRDETIEASSSSSSVSDRSFMFKKRNLFEEQDVEEEESVPPESILKRINSRKGTKSYQLGQQLTFKWTTGAGPRIVCVRDYPSELQFRALEEVNLSPRNACNSSRFYSSPRSIKCQSPKPAAISCMPKSKAGNTIFSKSEADSNIQSR